MYIPYLSVSTGIITFHNCALKSLITIVKWFGFVSSTSLYNLCTSISEHDVHGALSSDGNAYAHNTSCYYESDAVYSAYIVFPLLFMRNPTPS